MDKLFNIGLDAHCLGEQKGGNETYTRCLAKSFSEIDLLNNYYVYYSTKINSLAYDNIQWRKLKFNVPYIRVPFMFPYFAHRDNLDLLHMQYFSPFFCPAKIVLTVHDLAWKVIPQLFSKKEKLYFSYVDYSIARSAAIIAVSQKTKKDILTYYPFIAENKVSVIYNGIDHFSNFQNISDSELNDPIFKKDYILFVSNLHPKKNLELCIDAFSLLKKEMKDLKFVVVGRWSSNDYKEKILQSIKKQDLETEIIFKEVPTADILMLSLLYKQAKVFLYPSFYEGFGFPPLEAMQCGTVSVASNQGSLPEILKDSSLLCNIDNVFEFVKGIKELLVNSDLRKQLLVNGVELVKAYTWEKTANKTRDVYHKVLMG